MLVFSYGVGRAGRQSYTVYVQFDPIEIFLDFPYKVVLSLSLIIFILFSLKLFQLLRDDMLIVEGSILTFVEEDGANGCDDATGEE